MILQKFSFDTCQYKIMLPSLFLAKDNLKASDNFKSKQKSV